MFLKEKIFMIDYESTDMIDFLLDNKKIKDFNVSKSTFYQKINKFCWCLMVVIYFLMYYIYLFFWDFARKLNHLMNTNNKRNKHIVIKVIICYTKSMYIPKKIIALYAIGIFIRLKTRYIIKIIIWSNNDISISNCSFQLICIN